MMHRGIRAQRQRQIRDSIPIYGDETKEKKCVYYSKKGMIVTEKLRDIILHLIKCCWILTVILAS
jgi:hypothetical protein